MKSAEVVIVGGGIMGCTLGWRLAQAGMRPVILERSIPGAEASSAAAGILGPALEAHEIGLGLRLGLESRELHATQAEELKRDHDLEVGFRRCGALMAAFSEHDERALRARAEVLLTADIPHEFVSREEARQLEPELHPDIRSAILIPDEAQLDPRALLKALALAAEREGARFLTGVSVQGVRHDGQRVLGIEHKDGLLATSTLILAAGSWTSRIAGSGLSPDAIRPIRGQVLQTETRPPIFSRLVFGAGGYVVPRANGTTLIGSTEEEVGFERGVTLAGLTSILGVAEQMAPKLGQAPVQAHWSNFRPATPDGLPLIGAMPTQGLFLASGHFRNGILLGPVTASILSDALTGTPRTDLDAVNPKRFATTVEPA